MVVEIAIEVHRRVLLDGPVRTSHARVSSAEQNLNLQLDALKKAKRTRIYESHGSGTDSARLELLSCLKALRADDVLVV